MLRPAELKCSLVFSRPPAASDWRRSTSQKTADVRREKMPAWLPPCNVLIIHYVRNLRFSAQPPNPTTINQPTASGSAVLEVR